MEFKLSIRSQEEAVVTPIFEPELTLKFIDREFFVGHDNLLLVNLRQLWENEVIDGGEDEDEILLLLL